MDLDIVDCTLVRCVKLDADCARVSFTGTDSHVADGVSVLGAGAFACENDCFREFGIVKTVGVVCELQDGSANALTLQNSTTARGFCFFGNRPSQPIGNLVDSVG